MGVGQVSRSVESVPIKDTMLSEICPDVEAAFCFPQKYRTPNGECNNVKYPMFGVTGAAYLRAMPPQYDDGVGTPRTISSTGAHLPDALSLSRGLFGARLSPDHQDPSGSHDHLTALAAVWGEFVAHDISYTLPLSGYEQCCDAMFRKENPMECFPATTHSETTTFCQEYVRSAIGLKPGCALGPREQMNFATSFLDASAVYGSTPKSSEDLRLLEGGRLRLDPGRVLPQDPHNPNCRASANRNSLCFRSGDERVNHNAGLASLHTLFAREHNRIASKLAEVNPHWDEETLYQEARRVVGAEVQHITYNEFLPALLGDLLVETFHLRPKRSGYHMGYNDDLPVSAINSVANAILPFVMSLMPPTIKYVGSVSASKTFQCMSSMLIFPTLGRHPYG